MSPATAIDAPRFLEAEGTMKKMRRLLVPAGAACLSMALAGLAVAQIGAMPPVVFPEMSNPTVAALAAVAVGAVPLIQTRRRK
jgi:hypothetical protein